MSKTQRIDKILAHCGYGSRKELKYLIKEGVVTVNGKVIKDRGEHCDPVENEISVRGKRVTYKEFIYLMLNKPAGVISATRDNFNQTVSELVPEEFLHFEVFPVGRLDQDTEGLLILTNDGRLTHELLSPKKHVPKVYFTRVEGEVTEELGKLFSQGVTLDDGYKTLPAELKILESGAISIVELTIFEGKFHQVKRMFETVGKKVLYLKRIKMGGLALDETLELGKCRELTDRELKLLRGESLGS